jgi:hypothetical protein
MPEPGIRTEDVFYAIGFTRQDILNGAQIRSMQLSSENLKMLDVLHTQFGALAHAAERGLLVKKMIEVYFLNPFAFGDDDTFEQRFGVNFQVVEFFNETAYTLSNQYNIQLPPVIGKLTRTELPKQLGISMRAPSYLLP